MTSLQLDQRVRFNVFGGQLTGTVTRVWPKPAADPNVTIMSDDCRTFVRASSMVEVVAPAPPGPEVHDEGTSYCTSQPEHDHPELQPARSSVDPRHDHDSAARAAALVRQMNAWLRPAFGTTPADDAPAELVEWCRSARDLLADFADWTAAR